MTQILVLWWVIPRCIHSLSAELSKLAFEEMRSQAQQMADDLETAVRLSILEAEEHSKRLQIAEKEQKDASALSASSNSNDSASQSDSWKMELEAARQREQKVCSYTPSYVLRLVVIVFYCRAGFAIICDGAAASCREDGNYP